MAGFNASNNVFNPDTANVAIPDWTKVSQPITQPKPDETASTILKGVGESLDIGVKASDMEHQEYLKNNIYADTSALRSDYTQKLQNAKDQFVANAQQPVRVDVNGNPIGAPQASNQAAEDILGAHAEALPYDLESLPMSLETLGAAKASGKYSPTYLSAQYDSLAKDYRARFPGNRDYIDSVFEKYTGENPANAKLKGLLSDLNSYVVAANANKNKTLNLAYQHMDMEGMPDKIMGYKNGLMSEPQMLVFINKGLQGKAQAEAARYALETQTANRALEVPAATDALNTIARQRFTDTMTNLMTPSGVPMDMPKALASIKADPAQASAGALQLANNITQHQLEFADYVRAQSRIPGKDGRSIEDRMGGPDAVNKVIVAHNQRYEDWKGLLTNKEYGSAFLTAMQAKGLANDQLYTMMQDKDIGLTMRMLHAVNTAGGPEFAKALVEKLLVTDVPEKMKSYFVTQDLKLHTPDLNRAESGETTTLKSLFADGYKKNINSGKYYDGFISSIEGIAKYNGNEDQMTAKQAKTLSDAIFSPEGLGFVSMLKEDSRDERGNLKPGRMSTFSRLTSEDMTTAIMKLNQKYPGTAAAYKSWTTQTFSKELLGPQLNELTKIQKTPGMELTWNDETHTFGVNVGPYVGVNYQPLPAAQYEALRQRGSQRLNENYYPDPASLARVNSIVNQVNTGLRAVSRVSAVDGTSPNEYAMTIMKQFVDTNHLPGIPKAMLDSIVATSAAEQAKKEEFEKRYKIK